MPSETTPSPDRFDERAGAIVNQASHLFRWAARTSTEFARKLPGATAVEAELQQLERTVLGELRRRLDNVDPLHDPRATDDGPADSAPKAAAPPKQTEPLRVAMAELLVRSMEQTKQRAKEYLYLTVLRQLLPDEARILAALADGSAYPVIHVDCRTGVSGSRRLLANASTVGRSAGASELSSVPRYVTRLLHLDLVELDDADPTLSVHYDILLTDDRVRAAEEAARSSGRARIVRQTVRISSLGRELWDACHPREEAPAEPVRWEDVLREQEAANPVPVAEPSPVELPSAVPALVAAAEMPTNGDHPEPPPPPPGERNGTQPRPPDPTPGSS